MKKIGDYGNIHNVNPLHLIINKQIDTLKKVMNT